MLHSWYFLSERISAPRQDLLLPGVIPSEECQQFPWLHDSKVTVLSPPVHILHSFSLITHKSGSLLYTFVNTYNSTVQYNTNKSTILCFFTFLQVWGEYSFCSRAHWPWPLSPARSWQSPASHSTLHREVVWRIYEHWHTAYLCTMSSLSSHYTYLG